MNPLTKTTLELRFQNTSGGTVRLAVPDPKQPIDEAAVRAAMNQLVSLGVFISMGGDLVRPVEARLVTTTQDVWDMTGAGV